MNTSAKSVRFDDNGMWVDLSDGRILAVPLAWFPRLLHAAPKQRLKFEISPNEPHWDELDEDISIAGLLSGTGDLTRPATGGVNAGFASDRYWINRRGWCIGFFRKQFTRAP